MVSADSIRAMTVSVDLPFTVTLEITVRVISSTKT
ncbi:hypothetical protein HNP83_000698 [Rhizobium leguminosarum]|nr:hypothetical protein [Rhizobium leguminosarum]